MTETTEPLAGGRYVRSSQTDEYVKEPVEQPTPSGEVDQADAASAASKKGK